MSQPYIGEIRMFAGSFAPAGWALCNGALVPISTNDTLFNLIGTTYGGDGENTFALPNLCGRLPIHAGQGPGISQSYVIGEAAGVESVTLSVQQIPVHNHSVLVNATPGTTASPQDSLLAKTTTGFPYINEAPSASMVNNVILPVGGSQPHENMMPYLCVTFIISLFGIFPTQN